LIDSIKKIATVGTGGAFAQAITAISMPVLSRLYSPEAFAGWALFLSATMIFNVIGSLRYELAVVLPDTREDSANIMAICVVVSIATAFFSLLILKLIGSWLIGDKFFPEIKVWLWLVPFWVFWSAIYKACNFWCIKVNAFRWYSLSVASIPVFSAAFQLALGLLGYNRASGLIAGTIAAQFAALIFVVFMVMRKYGDFIYKSVTTEKMKLLLRRYKNYPLFITPYTLVGVLRDRMAYFLLGNFGGKADTGYYSISARVVNIPNSFISNAIRPVFFEKAARTDFISLEQSINQTLLAFAICIVPFWILFLFHYETLFALVLGEPWRQAGLYGAILSVPAVFLIFVGWLDRSFDVLGRQKIAFSLELIFSVLSISVLAIGIIYLKSIVMAIILQSCVLTSYYSCRLIAIYRLAMFDKKGLLKFVGVLFSIGAVSTLLVWLASQILSEIAAMLMTGLVFLFIICGYLLKRWKHIVQ